MAAWQRILLSLLLLAAIASAAPPAGAQEQADTFWYRVDGDGGIQPKLHFFWSKTCPHCTRARDFLAPLAAEHPWLLVQSYEVTGAPEHRLLFAQLAAALDEEIRGVPAFFLCGRMIVGFDNAEGMGARLLALAEACRDLVADRLATADTAPAPEASSPSAMAPPRSERDHADSVDLPLVGRVEIERLSLPVLTLVLGGIDAFNPCAFFVLLFLLSLLVHARSRARMLLVGGVFVVFSGLLYFLFMAAWLNLFLVLEGIRAVTLVAGLVAVALALVNIKDFFLFRQGPSLSIPESAKPGLFARMRGLISAEHLPTMLVGTVTLAIAANTYELLCTSGLPLVYTRALTLSDLSTGGYYLYIALYNVIYLVPLVAIVLAFTFTLGARKLSEGQGRALKLLSGLMMLGLGLVLIAAPELLDNWLTSVGLLALSIAVTWIASLLSRNRQRPA